VTRLAGTTEEDGRGSVSTVRRPPMAERITVDLGLQGGGAHGAFTWGVLDRLLDEAHISWAAISGASAGAMNAVVMADGLLAGGPAAAQKALWGFWKRVSRAAHRYTPAGGPFRALFLPPGLGRSPWSAFGLWGAAWSAVADTVTRTFSPYELNPFNLNPLLDLLSDAVDFERLRGTEAIRLFISATSVRTGALRIFRNTELSARAVMASACLPQLFQAVDIDGEAYWDGGYLGNPALLPLIAESAPEDLLIVQLNPPVRGERPRTAAGIAGRINEITFNASLVKELRSVALLKQALEEEPADRRFAHPLFDQVRVLRLHRIAADEAAFKLGTTSKLDPEWEFLVRLHGLGVRAAEAWLATHSADLGKRSTLDLDALA
jgi:NTE family protein